MKLYSVVISWYFDKDIENMCSKGDGHTIIGVYNTIEEARKAFHEERDMQFELEWPMYMIFAKGSRFETDIDTADTYWKARLDGYGYTLISIETIEV